MNGFWFFMLLSDLLIPVLMLVIGKWFVTRPPQKINHLYGYRTRRSMKNADTWCFAHRLCGRIWLRVGAVLLPLSVVPLLFVLGRDSDTVGMVGGIVCTVQLFPLVFSVIPVERALKQVFDENGNRRDEDASDDEGA